MPPRPKRAAKDTADQSDEIDVPNEPPEIDPYATLNVDKTATNDQIKSAYRRLALKHHPDKAVDADKATAHTKFQELTFAYAVLSDERRRRRYDVTGRTEESLVDDGDDGDFDWTTFYREQYADVVTTEKINEFSKQYKGSQEEKDDVLAAYERFEGDMAALYEEVMLSDPEVDEDHFRDIIDTAISAGDVEAFTRYTKESSKSRKRRIQAAKKTKGREAKEAEELAEELGLSDKLPNSKGKKTGDHDGNSALAAIIQQRQKGRSQDFLADLEAKYAPKSTKNGKRPKVEEPPEEAFADTAARKSKKLKAK